jgi:hypothetical protein
VTLTPEPTPVPATADQPQYPQVQVQLSGDDGNAHVIIADVTAALRRQVDKAAADAFATTALDCGSYDELPRLAMRTVHVS